MVNNLGLNGTATHHAMGVNNANIMNAVTDITQANSWNQALFGFQGAERTYLQRILP